MRALILGLATTLLAGNALAADYLRGSTFYDAPKAGYRWSGWYVGGQAGYASVDFQMGTATQEMVANIVRQLLVEDEFHISGLPNLPNASGQAASYGAFGGYNAQWGNVVLGLEVNYNHTSVSGASSDVIGRAMTTSNEFRNDVLLISNAWARLNDYGSFRARAGFSMGWVMPYMFLGAAIGNVSYSRSVTVSIQETDVSDAAQDPTDGIPPRPGGSLFQIATDAKSNAITYGYVAGAGVDVGVTKNIFLRGEYEFMELVSVGGIGFRINTIRAGAGLKF